jgi:hypothetical protein
MKSRRRGREGLTDRRAPWRQGPGRTRADHSDGAQEEGRGYGRDRSGAHAPLDAGGCDLATPVFALDQGLSDRAARLAEVLDAKVRRCFADCLYATSTLARWLGWSARKVQLAVRELADHGLVEVVRDYGLKTRRRIRLRWRVFLETRPAPVPAPVPAPDASMSASAFGECQTEFALTSEPPPDPPYKESEDNTQEGRTDGAVAGDPACGLPVPEEPASSSSPIIESIPPEDELPEPEAVSAETIAELVKVAAPVLGSGPAAEGRLQAWARRFGLPTLRKAIEVTTRKLARVKDPVAYTFSTMTTIAAEGGPVVRPARNPTLRPTAQQKAEFNAWMAARRAARGGGSP